MRKIHNITDPKTILTFQSTAKLNGIEFIAMFFVKAELSVHGVSGTISADEGVACVVKIENGELVEAKPKNFAKPDKVEIKPLPVFTGVSDDEVSSVAQITNLTPKQITVINEVTPDAVEEVEPEVINADEPKQGWLSKLFLGKVVK